MTKTLFSATTAEVCEHLGLSAKVLKKLRDEGYLQNGKHFRFASGGTVKPRLRWNPVACDEALTYRSRRLRVG